MPAEVRGREARIDGHVIALSRSYDKLPAGAAIEVGVRPEFVSVAPPAPGLLTANIERIDDLVKALEKLLAPNAVVLVKGSRFMKMERVSDAIAQEGP